MSPLVPSLHVHVVPLPSVPPVAEPQPPPPDDTLPASSVGVPRMPHTVAFLQQLRRSPSAGSLTSSSSGLLVGPPSRPVTPSSGRDTSDDDDNAPPPEPPQRFNPRAHPDFASTSLIVGARHPLHPPTPEEPSTIARPLPPRRVLPAIVAPPTEADAMLEHTPRVPAGACVPEPSASVSGAAPLVTQAASDEAAPFSSALRPSVLAPEISSAPAEKRPLKGILRRRKPTSSSTERPAPAGDAPGLTQLPASGGSTTLFPPLHQPDIRGSAEAALPVGVAVATTTAEAPDASNERTTSPQPLRQRPHPSPPPAKPQPSRELMASATAAMEPLQASPAPAAAPASFRESGLPPPASAQQPVALQQAADSPRVHVTRSPSPSLVGTSVALAASSRRARTRAMSSSIVLPLGAPWTATRSPSPARAAPSESQQPLPRPALQQQPLARTAPARRSVTTVTSAAPPALEPPFALYPEDPEVAARWRYRPPPLGASGASATRDEVAVPPQRTVPQAWVSAPAPVAPRPDEALAASPKEEGAGVHGVHASCISRRRTAAATPPRRDPLAAIPAWAPSPPRTHGLSSPSPSRTPSPVARAARGESCSDGSEEARTDLSGRRVLSPAPPLPLTRPIPDTRLPNSGDGGCGLAGGTGATYLLRGSGEGGGARGASAERARARAIAWEIEPRPASGRGAAEAQTRATASRLHMDSGRRRRAVPHATCPAVSTADHRPTQAALAARMRRRRRAAAAALTSTTMEMYRGLPRMRRVPTADDLRQYSERLARTESKIREQVARDRAAYRELLRQRHRVPTSELVQGPSSADIITGTSADIGRASMQQPLPPPAQDLPSEPEDSGATGPMAGALARVRGTGRLGTGEADMTLPVTGAFGAEWAAGGDVDLAGASRPMAEQMTTLNAQQRALAEQWRMLVSSLSAARPKPAPPPPPPPQQQQPRISPPPHRASSPSLALPPSLLGPTRFSWSTAAASSGLAAAAETAPCTNAAASTSDTTVGTRHIAGGNATGAAQPPPPPPPPPSPSVEVLVGAESTVSSADQAAMQPTRQQRQQQQLQKQQLLQQRWQLQQQHWQVQRQWEQWQHFQQQQSQQAPSPPSADEAPTPPPPDNAGTTAAVRPSECSSIADTATAGTDEDDLSRYYREGGEDDGAGAGTDIGASGTEEETGDGREGRFSAAAPPESLSLRAQVDAYLQSRLVRELGERARAAVQG